MNRVYAISSDGSTSPLEAIHCRNEESELQNLLQNNLDLIPGDQIDPDEPRRWLMVKREMMVEDPGTAEGRWSLDFLIVDQDGIPTLVECKRFKDTRARREVIGQMFDYAANASFYLSRDTLTQYLEEQARKAEVEVDALVASLQSPAGTSLDAFLELVQNNISEGQLRLVFFMEQAPPELRSIVAFLNSQMDRTEVCLVEARQFQRGDVHVVVPTLWGYTERARRIKKTVTVQKSGGRRGTWNFESFKNDAVTRLQQPYADALVAFYEFCAALPDCEIKWGGGNRGSFSVSHHATAPKSFITVLSDGEMWLNFNWLGDTPAAERFRNVLLMNLGPIKSLSLAGHNPVKGRMYSFDRWLEGHTDIERALAATVAGAPAGS